MGSSRAHPIHISQPARPIVKWAGGKQQLLANLLLKAPKTFNRYIEPFFGGGALFFALSPRDALLADSNPELINLYNVVSNRVDLLIQYLRTYSSDKQSYYSVRAQRIEALTSVERAARFLYLNRTCFNGLYRVNGNGEFNVPYGKYKNPRICDEAGLRAASRLLVKAVIRCEDYNELLLREATEGDFVYLDPPYLPTSQYSDFKRYTKDQFREDDHRLLAETIRTIHERGAHVLLTNSNHELVYELYNGFDIEVVQTRRSINCVGSRRAFGEDVIVDIKPKRRTLLTVAPPALSSQVSFFPMTRFMGSKQDLLAQIWHVSEPFRPNTVLDLFSGSGAVSYMFKAQGAQVFSNDYLALASTFSKAMIENNSVVLSARDIDYLTENHGKSDGFVSRTFDGLYFSSQDNQFIDTIRSNIKRLKGEAKKAIAMASLARACMKKRPRGIFTYTGFRYDDGRRDLKLSLREHFVAAVKAINGAVFDNGRKNQAVRGDAMNCAVAADLVYIDPPYFSPLSDNEYVRRYHFVEGLTCDWAGVEIQEHTKTRKFKGYPTPFTTKQGAEEALDQLFEKHRAAVLVVSYSSNSLPTREIITSALARHKRHVDVHTIDHQYSFGNQPHKVGNKNNRVHEYLFVGS